MSESTAAADGDTTVSFRIDRDRKRQLRIRAAQEGYENLTEYFHDLIDDDLRDAEIALE